jgi:methylenetetrahydrofolate reductase (NADPH)
VASGWKPEYGTPGYNGENLPAKKNGRIAAIRKGKGVMKIVDLWKPGNKPTVAFELFPAKTPKAEENLAQTIDALAGLKPDFASVTFGAGGSTREGSRQLAARLRAEKGLEVIAYFAGFGLGLGEITSVLEGYAEIGVENVLVVRGDPPRDPAFRAHPTSLSYASELLDFIRQRFSFCLGAAGYPEGHVQAANLEQDLDYLERKVDAGAEYIITNYFYDNGFFFHYADRCRARRIGVPIIPGIMPIYSAKLTETLAATCGAGVPETLRRRMAELPGEDKQAALDFGIEFALSQCRELLAAGVPGLLFYTMDRWESTAEIVRRLRAEGAL